MTEALRRVDYFVREPIVIDSRLPQKFLTAEDRRVDEDTLTELERHMDEGLYTRDIIYHGLTYRRITSKRTGPNCVNRAYTNVFVWEKGANHVYVTPPRK